MVKYNSVYGFFYFSFLLSLELETLEDVKTLENAIIKTEVKYSSAVRNKANVIMVIVKTKKQHLESN